MSPGAPRIKTERLILRAHRKDDLDAVTGLWGNRDVVRHIGGQVSTRPESWSRMLRYPGLWALTGYGYWAIEDPVSGQMIGEAGLADFKREITPPIDGLPEAGWVLDPAFHGRGLATEAMRAILGWADQNLDADQTCCLIDPGNTASIAVAAKLGYQNRTPARFRGSDTLIFWRPRASAAAGTP